MATGWRERTLPGGELPAKLLEYLFGVSGMSRKDEACVGEFPGVKPEIGCCDWREGLEDGDP